MKEYLVKLTNGTTYNAGTVFCVGQNYAKHIAEMGSTVASDPVIFIKPPQSILHNNDELILPEFSHNVHHEVELVILIGQDCEDISPNDAKNYIAGYGIGIDVTARDIQEIAKKGGKPWAVAKGFRYSAPISDFIPAEEIIDNSSFDLKLWIDGELKQSGNTKDMERTVEQLVSYLSKVFSLRKGDLVFTGTPEGVGKINSGNVITVKLNNEISLNIKVK